MGVVRTVRAVGVLVLFGFLTGLPSFVAQPRHDELLSRVRREAAADARRGSRADRQTLAAIYGSDAQAAHVPVSEVINVYAAAYDTTWQALPWWKKLPAEAGWLAAISLLIAFLAKEMLQSWAATLNRLITSAIYNRFAGSRFFRTKALKKYRDALGDKYRHIFLPFRPDEPLEMSVVYVPLKVKGNSRHDLVDAASIFAAHQRVVILGLPGSGKSMLFRNLAFSYSRRARAELFNSIPVLLELNRLNDSELTLLEHLVDIFRINGFPRAHQFVTGALDEGRLVVLLDGLDEVNTLKRDAVVQAIKDFLSEHESARVAVTCRTQVYRDQLADVADMTLEVVEFSDQQINHYLQAWQRQMPSGKSIEQLLETLRKTPNIMALARNPLLLTIVAFLYTRPMFVLPQSRTQFYSEAVKALFAPKPGVPQRFEESDKKLVLQHLALINQDRSAENVQDRRSIDRTTVLKEVGRVLRDLNQEEKDAAQIVDEIVARTGLLLAIDGGTAYQFAHLTLQEYFAAKALQPFPERLLEKFKADPDTWRETAKLYCGLDHDSTKFLQALRAISPITAFESLADAQQIDVEVATNVVEEFKSGFGKNDVPVDTMVRAFAAVASDQRPRGKAALDFLTEVLLGADSARAMLAAAAIAATNRPDAAEILTDAYLVGSGDFRDPLLQMGDLAVVALRDAATDGRLQAVFDLGEIGTPFAALALHRVMWSRNDQIASAAAFRLAALLKNSSVEAAVLSTDEAASRELFDERWAWVEYPFEAVDRASVGRLVHRIVMLLSNHFEGVDPDIVRCDDIDRRVAVPLAIHCGTSGMHVRRFLPIEATRWSAEILEAGVEPFRAHTLGEVLDWARFAMRSNPAQAKAAIVAAWRAVSNYSMAGLMACVDPALAVDLTARFTSVPAPERQDWENLSNPVSFTLSRSPHYWFTLALVAILSSAALLEIAPVVLFSPSWISWRVIIAVAGGCSIIAGWRRLIYGYERSVSDGSRGPRRFDHQMLVAVGIAPIIPLMYVYEATVWAFNRLRRKLHTFDAPDWEDMRWLVAISACSPAVIYYATAFTSHHYTWWQAGAGWSVLSLLLTALWKLGLRRDRLARNPLAGVLERGETAVAENTSPTPIIAGVRLDAAALQ